MREMKDSGIEWIGEIPATWECLHLKYLCTFKTGGTPNGKKGIDFEGDYPWITPQDIQESFDIEKYTQYISKESLRSSNFVLFPRGTILLVCIASVGKVGIINTLAYANQQITALKANDSVLPRFLGYVVSAGSTQMAFDASSNVIPIINTKYLQNFSVACPPLSEQKNIVTFLDSKCSEIDAISAGIQKEIEILEQYKRSVITEAVTKGLNPDVEMKDSGIEWVGNIPVHWDTIPIRYLFAECRLKNILNQEKTALKFTYGTIIKKANFDSDSDEYVANTMTNYTVVYPGTIMINGLNLNYDFVSQRVGLVKDRGAITSAYLAIVPGSRVVSEYANYQLKSWDYAKAFHNMGTGVRKTLDFSELGKKYFVTPSIEEQSKIVAFLDSKCKEIEAIIASKKQQLTVIDSYKKSLIYEYVTGKKEVI